MSSILWIISGIVLGYLALVLLMYLFQAKMIYHPRETITATPSSIGLDYENIRFSARDDVQLHGWFLPVDSTAPTVLYMHGNAGNISGRLQTIQLLHDLGLNVFIFDYRGYGQSTGTPSEEGTYSDAEAAWNYLVENRDIPQDQIVIMGRSLGGAIAAWLAAHKASGVVIIESTFTSAADLGAELYSLMPVRWMIKYNYPTLDYIRKIEEPLFMAHSRDDQIVPYHHGRELFESANDPKVFVELRGSHGSGFWATGTKYRNSLKRFLEQHTSLNSGITE